MLWTMIPSAYLDEAEEGVVFHTALPQVFASLYSKVTPCIGAPLQTAH